MSLVVLRDVVTVRGGGTPSKSVASYYGGPIPWVTPKDMKRPLIGESEVTLTDDGVRNSPAKLVPPGSVLVVVRSGVLKHTLPVALSTQPVTVNQDLKALTPSADLDAAYLARMLKALQPVVLSWVRATTADNFPIDSLLDLRVDVPSLSEQRRIAAILDHVDALRAKRRQVLNQLDALTQSIFHGMFSDGLPQVPLGELAETRLGKMLDAKQQTGDHLRPYLRNANVQWFRFDLTDLLEMDFNERDRATLSLRRGDVLVCEGGQPGRSAIWRGELEECYFQKALHRVRLGSDLEPEYFVRAMKHIVDSGGLKDFVTSSTIAHLTGEKLRTLPIPVPPLDLQRKFAMQVAQIGQMRAGVSRACASDGELFASLQSRAFRGEL